MRQFLKECKVALHRKVVIPLGFRACKIALKAVMRSCQVEISGLNEYLALAEKEKCILALWHNRLAPVYILLEEHTPFSYSALISNSRDGELLARLVESHKRGFSIRVSHNARHQALKEVIHQLKVEKRIIIITPDGPQGPVYEVKPGIIMAAKISGASIIPMTWTGDKFWELGSWDRFRIPKPFSKIQVTFGNAIKIDRNDERSDEVIAKEIAMRL